MILWKMAAALPAVIFFAGTLAPFVEYLPT
jgi:hypothetical protein